MLLRLRQICAHPSLITEDGQALTLPGEHANHTMKVTELQRAERLVGPEFVMRMKEKFRTIALERMAAEKEVSHYLISRLYPTQRCSVVCRRYLRRRRLRMLDLL